MFNFLAPILILGIITLGVYRIFELYVRRKERMMMIEKFQGCVDSDLLKNRLNLPFVGKSRNSNWTLRASLLMIGLGLGFIVGLCLQATLGYQLNKVNQYMSSFQLVEIIIFASVILFGGIGLLIAHLIERKGEKNKLE